jgi:hypothetical protein
VAQLNSPGIKIPKDWPQTQAFVDYVFSPVITDPPSDATELINRMRETLRLLSNSHLEVLSYLATVFERLENLNEK